MKRACTIGTKEDFMKAIEGMKQCQVHEELYISMDGKTIVELISINHLNYKWIVKNINENKSLTSAGYYMIHTRNGNRLVHRLMAEAWLLDFNNWKFGDNRVEVDHIDGNKTNNHINNLRLVTHSTNMRAAWKNNLIGKPNFKYGKYYKSTETLHLPNGDTIKMTPKEYLEYRRNNGLVVKKYMEEV